MELGAGAHGAAGLALAKLDIARHVLITEGTNDENIMNLLIQNCRNSNSNSAAADAVSSSFECPILHRCEAAWQPTTKLTPK